MSELIKDIAKAATEMQSEQFRTIYILMKDIQNTLDFEVKIVQRKTELTNILNALLFDSVARVECDGMRCICTVSFVKSFHETVQITALELLEKLCLNPQHWVVLSPFPGYFIG